MINSKNLKAWELDCKQYYGRILDPSDTYAHWCNDWDDLPINSTSPEFESCTCFPYATPYYTKNNSGTKDSGSGTE